MSKICPLFSGSTGNSTYIEGSTGAVLADAGASCKALAAAIQNAGGEIEKLAAVVITHEHIDHISGLGVLSRKYNIPIYATKGTINAIRKCRSIGEIDTDLFCRVSEDERLQIKDLTIHPMKISHDAAQPVGYRISYGREKVAVCTDIGVYNDYTVECLKGLDAVVIEANHDVRMLQTGPYPYPLKQRILGDRGHLSNENCGRLLCRILHDGMKHIVLGHLSKENNIPELAYEAVRMEVTMGDCPYTADDFPIMVAKRDEPSPMICLS